MTSATIDPTLDLAKNVKAFKERLQAKYDDYCTNREAENWAGYNTEEAQDVDGFMLGYIAALEDFEHIMAGGVEWRNMITEEAL